MAITLDGSLGVTTPTYGGTDTSEYIVPVTGFKNRIINGAMMIDQRNAGASVNGTGTFPVDRFSLSSSGVGVYSGQRSTTAPANFLNSIILTVTTPDSSVTGTDNCVVLQRIEGFNFADMAWGTANASTITISFWVRSSITGTYFVRLANNNYDRSYCASYTISAANTWEYKTITIGGDTTGTWATNNSSGVAVEFVLGNGTTYQTSSANTWIAGNYLSTSSQTNWISTNGATFYITGVQLEKGSTATSFDYRPYGTELQLCQRYYYLLSASANNLTFFHNVWAYTTTVAIGTIVFPQVLRTSPSLVTSGTASNYRVVLGGTFTNCSAVPTTDQLSPYSMDILYTVASGLTVGQGGSSCANSSTAAILGFNAEL